MIVLLPPFLLLCGLSEGIVSRAQDGCGDRVREAQGIYECLMPDLRYARSWFYTLTVRYLHGRCYSGW